MIERVEEAAAQLPAHERKRGAGIRAMQRRGTCTWCVGRPEQIEPAARIVADLGDPLRGDRCGGERARRPSEQLDAVA